MVCETLDIDATEQMSLTREVPQTQLTQAKVSVVSVVEEDGKGVVVLVQLCPSDDSQVLQWQVVKLVQSHQDIARHFPDRLQAERGTAMLAS